MESEDSGSSGSKISNQSIAQEAAENKGNDGTLKKNVRYQLSEADELTKLRDEQQRLDEQRRELKEERGGSGGGLQKIADFDAGENNGWEFISLYEGRYSGKVRFPAAEVDSVQWFTPEQIQAWVERRPQDFSPAFIPCWNAWLVANRKNHSNSNTYHDKP